MNMDRLVVAVVGNPNSGKSHTWDMLFGRGRPVRTGIHERDLPLCNGEVVSVFLVSGAPQERKKRGKPIGEIIRGNPRIVLCSLQYRDDVPEGVFGSFQYFFHLGFFAFVHWLNPGFHNPVAEEDHLGLVPYLLAENSLIGIRDARIDATDRVEEMRDFIRGWALRRNLVRQG